MDKEGLMSMQKTGKLFAADRYQKTATAKILDASYDEKKQGICVILDETIFFPEGGGQSCDTGRLNGYEVFDVKEKEGRILHYLKTGDASGEIPQDLKAGNIAECQIDWDRRFLNMQRHCGEHILSGIFYRLYGGVNRGFHMGADYMTIDISLEDKPEITELTWDMVMEAELEANRVIWQDAPVIIRHFDTRQEAENLPLRKKLALEKDITIVCVGSIDEPSDCVACCGTHPNTAGQVGIIKILKMESYKGMYRIYCEAGKNALRIFDSHHETLTKLGNRYSASPDKLMEKIEAAERKNQEAKDSLFKLRKALVEERIDAIKNSPEEVCGRNYRNLYYTLIPGLDAGDLTKVGNASAEGLQRPLTLQGDEEKVLLLFSSGSVNCGKLVKEMGPAYQGKGGGGDKSARVAFPDKESLTGFLTALDDRLQQESEDGHEG